MSLARIETFPAPACSQADLSIAPIVIGKIQIVVPEWWVTIQTRGLYHVGRRPACDDSFHSPTVIPPSALDKPSVMKHYHRRRTCSHTSPRHSPTMVTFHDSRFVECRCWTVKTVVTRRSSAYMIPAPISVVIWTLTL